MASQKTSRDVSHITKFNGTNFPMWKFVCWLLFDKFGFVDLVSVTKKNPDEVIAAGVVTNQASITPWKKKSIINIINIINK
jgi:hypothetical protein